MTAYNKPTYSNSAMTTDKFREPIREIPLPALYSELIKILCRLSVRLFVRNV